MNSEVYNLICTLYYWIWQGRDVPHIIHLPGGTRSGKTYNMLRAAIWCINHVAKTKGRFIRPNYSDLLLDSIPTYQELAATSPWAAGHDITAKTFSKWNNDSVMTFYGGKNTAKLHGPQTNLTMVDEAIFLPITSLYQLLPRTSELMVIAYNPYLPDCAMYDYLDERERLGNLLTLTTTYKDNPHLTATQIAEIEHMALIDPEWFKCYGLGQRPKSIGVVYEKFGDKEMPEWSWLLGYGVDVGITLDQTAIVALYTDGQHYWVELLHYEKTLTPELFYNLLIEKTLRGYTIVMDGGGPGKGYFTHCSHTKAMPELVEASKGAGSVVYGIETVIGMKTNIVPNEYSKIIEEERKGYNWPYDLKTNTYKKGIAPIVKQKHALDAIRYICNFASSQPEYSVNIRSKTI